MKTLTPLLAVGALAGAAARAASRSQDDLRGEVAVVTGASRGLGLLIAHELAGQGCRLVICARDAAELDRAAGRLRETGAEVTAVACDVTDEATPTRLVQTALDQYGRLDIVVSNAGIIQVGPVQEATPEHFETALDTMALAPARLALAALPVMRDQGHGRIVTIASIGGKLSVPHLLPYSTAKFAAVGFSEGLRAELGRGPVVVTTVVPGLMRTGSHLQARFTGQAGKEFTWFGLGASLPLISMDAERAARQIVAAVRQRRAEVTLTPAGQVVSRVAALAPGVTSGVMQVVERLVLPAPDGEGPAAGGDGIAGQDLEPALPRTVFDRLTALGRAAAGRFNERRAGLDERRAGLTNAGPGLTGRRAGSGRALYGLPIGSAVRKEPSGRMQQTNYEVPAVVPLPAEIDLNNAEAVSELIGAALEPGVTVVVADLTGTAFCDSSGLRYLLLAQE